MRTIALYALLDLTARQTGGPIMAFNHDAAAIRAFHDTLQNKDILPGKYPEQFDLIKIGHQDEDTGGIILTNFALHDRSPSGEYLTVYGGVEVIATGKGWKDALDGPQLRIEGT